MNEQYILYVCDTETTGLDPEKNEIIEISFVRIADIFNTSSFEQKTWKLKALNALSIEDEALRVNGHKREDILHQTTFGKNNYLHPDQALEQIEEWICQDGMSAHDRVFIGHNPYFDFNMMIATWKRQNVFDSFPFLAGRNDLVLDTKKITLLIDVLVGKKRSRYNLGSIISAYGIKKDKAHSADGDTRMTKDLACAQIKGLQKYAVQDFGDKY